jgi:hypothetical protein
MLEMIKITMERRYTVESKAAVINKDMIVSKHIFHRAVSVNQL